MTDLQRFSAAVATIAFSILGACGQSEVHEQTQSIEITDPYGAARSVTVLEAHRGPTDGYAEVRMGDREFSLAQWIDGDGARHRTVSSGDGDLTYEYVARDSGGEVVLGDTHGSRAITDGDAVGSIDVDAATLLMSFRPGDHAYEYQTICVYYDTSNPADWHLYLAGCTCAHWYSLFCAQN